MACGVFIMEFNVLTNLFDAENLFDEQKTIPFFTLFS